MFEGFGDVTMYKTHTTVFFFFFFSSFTIPHVSFLLLWCIFWWWGKFGVSGFFFLCIKRGGNEMYDSSV